MTYVRRVGERMKIKEMYEKMVDYRHFGIILLIVGVFFYFGLIIPNQSYSEVDQFLAAIASMSFLIGSIGSLSTSKKYEQQLQESEEGQEYISNQKRP
jgi:cell division protein FtsB